jgi:hypothetical protein
MATTTSFLARGKVTGNANGKIVFQPANTNYEIHLEVASGYSGPLNQLIDGRIKAKARKVYTVPSGGGFITPLFGPMRIVQGRVMQVEELRIIIRGGVAVEIELPTGQDSIDLEEGPITVGNIANAVILPGAMFEWVNGKQN